MKTNLLKSLLLIIIAAALIACVHMNTKETDSGSFTFVQMCDTQLGFGNYHYERDVKAFEQAVKQINELNPDFVLICGDMVEAISDKTVSDFFRIKNGFKMPVYCAPGNHEISNVPTDKTLKKYRDIFGPDYYSFYHKGYTFVVANTQFWKSDIGKETITHDEWFKTTLESASANNSPVFVAGHYPLFLNEPEEADEYFNITKTKRLEILELLKKHGVIAMLGGHTHRTIANNFYGIQFVNGETTSVNFDKRPLGYRVWNVTPSQTPTHKFVPVEGIEQEELKEK